MAFSALEDRVVAVTGATGRLGRLVVQALEEERAHVAAFVRTDPEARLVPVAGDSRVRPFVCDVTDGASVASAFEAVAAEFGRVDALIHTVGMWAMTPLLDTSPDAWRHVVDVNLWSTYLCFRSAARLMTAGDGGALVAVASAQGADRGAAGQSAYSAAKGGLVRLVEATADELAGHGVRVRAVAPSTILFGGETGEGVPARAVVRLCLDAAVADAAIPTGSIIRAYGTAG